MRNRLKVLRAERDWSQAELAEKLEEATLAAQEKGSAKDKARAKGKDRPSSRASNK